MELAEWRAVPRAPHLSLPMRLSLLLSALVAFGLSGCGSADELAVAAGAAVGGCALLDTNDDSQISEDETAYALFDNYDTDDDGTVSRAEFDAGVARGTATASFRGEFDDWDSDDDGLLTRGEFADGATATGDLVGVADASCDEIGL